MSFGKSFKTLKEAKEHLKKIKKTGREVEIRVLSKKLFPRRTKRFHVGTHLDFLNFA